MLKLATILQNPGEPAIESRYHDLSQLRDLGYNGLVLYETIGLSGVVNIDQISDGELRGWIAGELDRIGETITRARRSGLGVYIFSDLLCLPQEVVASRAKTLACVNRSMDLCPGSDATIELCGEALNGLLDRLPRVDGVVLRFGDNSASNLPHLTGNDIYRPRCTRCESLDAGDRVCKILDYFYNQIVTRRDLRLIARAWNVRPGGLHDSVTLCQRVADRLPADPSDDRFVLSFKFSHTDFWRYQRWNPCTRVFADRPVLYELQCQREFEGKGALPNWQVPLWRDGPSERPAGPMNLPATVGDDPDVRSPEGWAGVTKRANVIGLWAWVRGGGWGGPFVKNETWIDANVFAVPRLADHPDLDPREIAREWITQRLGVQEGAVVDALIRVLENSPDVILKGFYIEPFARSKADSWNPNNGWIQDDLIDARAAWRIVEDLRESDLDDMIREKQEVVDRIAADRANLQGLLVGEYRGQLEPLVNSLIYAESLLSTLKYLLTGLVGYRRFRVDRDPGQAKLCQRGLIASQSHWNHHTQRHGSLPGCATAFREVGFWELTQQILSEVIPVAADSKNP